MTTKSQQVSIEWEDGTMISTPKWETSGVTSGRQILSGSNSLALNPGESSTAIEGSSGYVLVIQNEEIDITTPLLEDKELRESIERAREEMRGGDLYFSHENVFGEL